MNRSVVVPLVVLLGIVVGACASSDGQDTSTDPATDETAQDLTGKHCGTFLNGACPKHYWCDMGNQPPGTMGGSGVCRKEKPCVLNGVLMCPKGETFDPTVCHCR